MEPKLQIFLKTYLLPLSILSSAILISGALVYNTRLKYAPALKNAVPQAQLASAAPSVNEEEVLPSRGVVLPIRWGDLGKKMTDEGVIDMEKFTALYEGRGGLDPEIQTLLAEDIDREVRITPENAQVYLNVFWGLGLGSKNIILEKGPMTDPKYNGAENFASTGGWTLAKNKPMDHYSKHEFFALTADQQALVEKISQGIYRPCCNNSTYFPDCNHGMAMLGLLELLASQGVSEDEMYKIALQVNAYWFPDTYVTLAKYFKKQGIEWAGVNPKDVLGVFFSSSSGYQRILSEVEPAQSKGGGGCSV